MIRRRISQRNTTAITVEYFQNTYKFVPADYQETEEDKAMEAAGDYFISYGNDKVEVRESSSVQWEKDGISYMIQGFDIDISRRICFPWREK